MDAGSRLGRAIEHRRVDDPGAPVESRRGYSLTAMDDRPLGIRKTTRPNPKIGPCDGLKDFSQAFACKKLVAPEGDGGSGIGAGHAACGEHHQEGVGVVEVGGVNGAVGVVLVDEEVVGLGA